VLSEQEILSHVQISEVDSKLIDFRNLTPIYGAGFHSTMRSKKISGAENKYNWTEINMTESDVITKNSTIMTVYNFRLTGTKSNNL